MPAVSVLAACVQFISGVCRSLVSIIVLFLKCRPRWIMTVRVALYEILKYVRDSTYLSTIIPKT